MIEWKKSTAQYSNGYNGISGKIQMFYICWDGSSGSKHPEGPWILTTKLPGLKTDLGHYKEVGEAECRAEQVLIKWMEMANFPKSKGE